jgi:hypothetical protein
MAEALENLRRDWPYRAYVRGFRGMLICFLLLGLCAFLGASGVIDVQFIKVAVVIIIPLTVLSLISGMVGWIAVPNKNSLGGKQAAFLRAVVHDLFRGLPR